MAKPNARTNDGPLGFEATLWAAADKLRGHMDAAEYKHVVLGLIFLKYISDAFEIRRSALAKDSEADPEDRDEYIRAGVFWVPVEARWETLHEAAKRPEIGVLVDKGMEAIERDNHRLKGVLPKDYARPALDKARLGELIDLVGDIALGEDTDRSRDVLGRVYEYFLGQFASKEGKKAGEFYTPRCIVHLLVEMIEPYEGRVYDPCCGSAGMFVQSETFTLAHGGRLSDISVFGQESNPTTWKLAKMNLALRGIEADLGPHNADTFHDDLHPDLRADFILANPPFNMSDWGGDRLRDDARWVYGVPPVGNANFAWVQHFVHHLAPGGIAGFVLANSSLSSGHDEAAIRRTMLEADLVDCIVDLPGRLFYGTGALPCLWIVARARTGRPTKGGESLRNRTGELLLIDARQMGTPVDRTHIELAAEEISTIASTYHRWRLESAPAYADVPGFCRSATVKEIAQHQYVLTPGTYTHAEPDVGSDEPLNDRLKMFSMNLGAELSKAVGYLEDLKAVLPISSAGSTEERPAPLRVRDLAEMCRQTLNPQSYPDELFHHYSIPAFDDGKVPSCERGQSIKSTKLVVQPGAVLLSRLNPRIPRVWMPDLDERHRAICSGEFLVLVPKPPATREFLYAMFVSRAFMRRFSALATGVSGSHQRVRPQAALDLEMALPSSREMEIFSRVAVPIVKLARLFQLNAKLVEDVQDDVLPDILNPFPGKQREA